MQVIFLPTGLALALCFIIWPVLQISAAVICRQIPDSFYKHNRFIFKSASWERGGAIYRSIGIRSWKRFLPDGAAVVKGGFRKKRLEAISENYVEKYIIESCRAELGHWLAILPFWIFGFFTPFPVVIYMLVYALIVNFPCILAQRYNRPRFLDLLNKMRAGKQPSYDTEN